MDLPTASVEPQPRSTYVAPAECPSRPAWLEALRARLPALLRTHPLVEAFEVQIERDPSSSPAGYRGALESTASPGASARREVKGASCDEVLEALSFIGALELQRVAETSGSPSAPLTPNPLTPEPAPPSADRVPPRGITSSRSWSWGAQAFALFQGEIRPAATLDWGLGLQLAGHTPRWQPWLLLGAYWGSSDVRTETGASASVQHVSAHAVGCPLRFPSQGAFALRPCLDFDLGRVSGEGHDVSGSEQHAAPWLSGGVQFRGDLLAWDRLQLGAWVGAVVPFWHSRFYLIPDQVVFEPASLGLRAGGFAGLIF